MEFRRFVIPDIHGCALTLIRLVEEVIRPEKKDRLYFLGDYIDRGPRSKEVIDAIIRWRKQGLSLHLLRGNHEEMFISAHESSDSFRLWILNGGYATLDSFGVHELGHIPPYLGRFFRNLPYYLELEDFILVHGGFNFQAPDPFSDTEAMLWDRTSSVDRSRVNGKRLISGHTPKSRKEIEKSLSSDLITIDNGCVYTGRAGLGSLTALELNTLAIHFQENID